MVEIDNREFNIIIATDVIRNGIGLELSEKKTNSVVLEIFRNDSKKAIEFMSMSNTISLNIIEKAIEIFDKEIGREYLS